MENRAIQKLRGIGLNQLEAEVYYLLLREDPMTAYRIGKLLKKPTANIYKAVEVLFNKGAIVIEEGKNKLCKAVNPDEFIAIQESAFISKTKELSSALATIKAQPEEEATYVLDSVDLALEKVKRMIDMADVIIVVDAFPVPLEMIAPNLEAAVKRGVEVTVQAYGEQHVKGADVLITPKHDDVISYWNSQQLNVVVDGQESLIALFDKTMSSVFHATWSTNVYLSCIVHAGRVCEQTIHRLMSLQDGEDKLNQIEKILSEQKFFRNSNVPGVKRLFDQYLIGKE